MLDLRRKLSKLSLFDGASLVTMGVLSLGFGIFGSDIVGILIGVALFSLGCIELQGRRYLRSGNPTATRWLVGAQIGLLLVILSYCLRSLAHPPLLPVDRLPGQMSSLLEVLPGYAGDLNEALRPLLRLSYCILIFVSILYQGGMALYYWRKTPLALQTPPRVPPPLPAENPSEFQ